MRYADAKCTYKEVYKPSHMYIFTGKCVITGEEYSVAVPAQELYAYRQGGLIQNCLVSVSKEAREFLVSGVSPNGWYEIYPDDEEEALK